MLGDVHDVEDGRAQMGHGSDGLHFDCVSVLEIVVQNTGRVDHLPSEIFVIGVADVQRLGGESVRLHFDVSLCDLDEANGAFLDC